MPDIQPRPPVTDSALSMILVSANAELFLDHLLDRWRGVLDADKRTYEIVLVDDGSSDGSLALAEGLAQKSPKLTVVSSSPPHGIGAALKAGLAACSSYPLVGYAEFSPDYSADDLGKFLEALNQVDVVSGVRANHGSRWSWRRLLERWVFGVRLTDPACPFKVFRRTVFDHLPLQSRGDFVHTEIVAKANFLGALLAEMPVSYQRTGTLPPDPYWKEDMRLIFRRPDFGPPPTPPAAPPAGLIPPSSPTVSPTDLESWGSAANAESDEIL
jgi:glycosyltransferase involved in cell wall biosynthesis